MRPRRLSYTFLLSFIICIFLLQWKQLTLYPTEIWQRLLILGLLGSFALPGRNTRNTGAAMLALTLGICTALGTVARTTHMQSTMSVDAYANGQMVEIHGIVAAEPDRRPMQTKYTIAVEELRTASGTIIFPVRGKVLATDHSGWPEYAYNDRVEVYGKLEKPSAIETFEYDKYLSRFGIYTVIYRASIRNSASLDEYSIKRTLFALKEKFEKQINRLYAEPHASFMAGLLTGSRRGIPENLMNDFNVTGLTHIIAISGYNITIVIAVMTSLLFWLPLKTRFFPAITAIIGFTIFVGASAAVVRASIMGILGLLALQVGRQSEMRLTILWTLFGMLMWNPKYLWYDAGFQLSFLAVLGLIEIAPLLEPLCKKIPTFLGIREALQMTIAAQISAVPLILFLFGRLSLVAPIANVLVAPFIPLAMLFGFCGTVVSFFWFPLGQLISYLGWGCLEWIILVANTLTDFPLASVEIGSINGTTISLYYLLICLPLIQKQLTFPLKPRN